MQQDKITILCTRPVDASLVKKAEAADIVIEPSAFISIEYLQDKELQKHLLDLSRKASNVVFTSMNAAEAVAGLLQGAGSPDWKIFCLGHATKVLVQKYFPGSQVNGKAPNASLLADEILGHAVKEVIFFCGDNRREELPGKLAANNVAVKELVVYKTLYTPQRVSRNYDGILFFSPSAVESFFQVNTILPGTVLFAIGATTATTIEKFCKNKILVSDLPVAENLVEKAITYFDTIKPFK